MFYFILFYLYVNKYSVIIPIIINGELKILNSLVNNLS